MTEPHVVVHTDGACSGNPGPGGWGAILEFNGHRKELSGGAPETMPRRGGSRVKGRASCR